MGYPFLNLIHLVESNGSFERIPVNVIHAMTPNHLDIHKDWIDGLIAAKRLRFIWNPTESLFPFLEYSNLCAPDSNWENFRKRLRETPQENKKAVIITMAKQVAERNGYVYDQKISELNQSDNHIRIIYSGGRGKEKIYLSFDVEKGGFEVCNHLGQHQGEYFFDGVNRTYLQEGMELRYTN